MNELALIARLLPSLPTNRSVVLGAGDDCAVLDLGLPDQWVLFKTDAIVEGIHFTSETEPARIGHKALARCLSDMAAMAGTPRHAVVTLALPRTFEPETVDQIYRGLNALASKHGVAVVGGEITTNPERLLISVAMLGTVGRAGLVSRAGSKAGDALMVTGTLGGSIEGKHLDFEPRLAEAAWLAKNFSIHSMIDLSDGLASDLRHLMEAGKVGAELLSSAIPISAAARRRARDGGKSDRAAVLDPADGRKPPLLAALTDGEDYELLFTIASRDAVPLLDAWKSQFPNVRLSCIGKVTAGSQLSIRTKQGVQTVTAHGYVHFPESGRN